MLDNESAYYKYNSCTWSVTFTIKPELYGLPAFRQLSKTWDKLHEKLRMYTQSYVCVAELTAEDNIHFHTILQPSTLSPYSLDLMQDSLKGNKLLGICHINRHPIENKSEWIRTYKYITKEYAKTYRIVNRTGAKQLYDIISYGKIEDNEDNEDEITVPNECGDRNYELIARTMGGI